MERIKKESEELLRKCLLTNISEALSKVKCSKCKNKLDKPRRFTCGHNLCIECIKYDVCVCPYCHKKGNITSTLPDMLIKDMVTCLKNVTNAIKIYEQEQDLKSKLLKKYSYVNNDKFGGNSSKRNSTERRNKRKNFSPVHILTKKAKTRSLCSTLSDITVDLHEPSTSSILNAFPLKDVNKRNAVGETPLHRACKKGDLEKVTELLRAGATLNVKDYAGWTPLHEAINAGHIYVVEKLLDWGSLIDVPGDMYVTPLHKAVMKKNVKIIAALVSKGASERFRTYEGKTAGDLIDEDLGLLLLHEHTIRLIDNIPLPPLIFSSYCVYLNRKDYLHVIHMETKLKSLGIMITDNFTGQVTLMAVYNKTVSNCFDYNILVALVCEIPVITFDWLESCVARNKIIPFDNYLIIGCKDFIYFIGEKVLENRRKLFPRLFDGCNFYLSNFDKWTKKDEIVFNKQNMIKLIKAGSGTILTREPHLRNVALRSCYPWHASSGSAVEQCYNYIIYRGSSELQYKMLEIRHAPANWIVECIWKYKLLPPEDMELASQ